eukprot:TRINITY_DN7877_c4_g1_i1.p1 TRINITY_DN7877_c4_g1~~TRINITY_DN7877_c4_g1_i1.p1  ORF type:complete len:462 (-),score=81.35 TRINITY_DN7877_c4_g1_i1:79-1464(-)
MVRNIAALLGLALTTLQVALCKKSGKGATQMEPKVSCGAGRKASNCSDCLSHRQDPANSCDGDCTWALGECFQVPPALEDLIDSEVDELYGEPLQYFRFGKKKEVQIPHVSTENESRGRRWKGFEQVGRALQESLKKKRKVYVLKDLLHKEVADALIEASRNSPPRLHQDPVDGLPAYQLTLLKRMKANHSIAKVLESAIQEKILPFVRERYACPECVVCDAIVRRYRHEERTSHSQHFDNEAYVTAVADLRPSSHVGGLYLQRNWSTTSRKFLRFEQGDIVFHQFDLSHGVEVRKGSRYSLVLFIKDRLSSCLNATMPWYGPLAEQGNADAQFNLGQLHRRGAGGVSLNKTLAYEWTKKAALQGHALAQNSLGAMLAQGEGIKKNSKSAMKWATKAALLGDASSQVNLGKAYLHGFGVPKNRGIALDWIEKASEQQDPEAMQLLMQLLIHGADEKQKDEL